MSTSIAPIAPSLLAVRIHPTGVTVSDLIDQWLARRAARPGYRPIALLRTVPQDAEGLAFAALPMAIDCDETVLASAWAEAQPAADASLLGLAVGVRIALIPQRGRWFADSLVIRSGGRIRVGRGHRSAIAALRAVRSSFIEAIATAETSDACTR